MLSSSMRPLSPLSRSGASTLSRARTDHLASRALASRVGLVALLLVGSVVELAASAQVFVVPRRAGKSRVRYFDFAWRHVDILVGLDATSLDADRVAARILEAEPDVGTSSTTRGATITPARFAPPDAPSSRILADLEDVRSSSTAALELGPMTGGVRLFFYDAEIESARHAAASIEASYRKLVQQFRYIPQRTFPYVLYNSYQEFLQTNLFPVQEGILGVTSTRGDLRLTLPYFGDFQYFRDVSVHEMVHQFTIQKVRGMAERVGVRADPLERFPLWYIEGIAEFYAKGGVDGETDMLVRDILLNPDVENGYAMLDFWADRPGSGLWTYKVGQIRLCFLAETYGTWTVQEILERSPLLVADVGDEARVAGFPGLVALVTGDEARVVASKFDAWLKRRAFGAFLGTKQSHAAFTPLEIDDDYIDALNASPSGALVMYRAYDVITGRAKLVLIDAQAPKDGVEVIMDGKPGVESLHPVTKRTFDLTEDTIAFIAEADGGDVLYVQGFDHRPAQSATTAAPRTPIDPFRRLSAPPRDELPAPTERWDADLSLGDKRRIDLTAHGILTASSPAIAPDGRAVALVGLHQDGDRDIFVVRFAGLDDDDAYSVERLTRDRYAERDVAWGPGGIVYSSDATSTRHFNLFRVDPQTGARTRLTSASEHHLDPEVTPSGRVFFSAYAEGAANLYEALGAGAVRRTDILTGLFAASPGPKGGLWALLHHQGRRRIVEVADDTLTLAGAAPWARDEGSPYTIPSTPLDVSVPYDWTSIKNWELGGLFGFLGASSFGIFGRLFATANDRLRNHATLLTLNVLGSLELTDGQLLYFNQTGRLEWGFGPAQTVRFRADRQIPGDEGQFVRSFERFFGGYGLIRYPFDKFFYLQSSLQLGGSTFALDGFTRDALDRISSDRNDGLDRVEAWQARHGATRFQSEITVGLGYDTTALNRGTGPIAGTSILLENSLGLVPFEGEYFGALRLDAEQYFPLIGRSNLLFRVGAASTYGGQYQRQFQLLSFDTLRGVPFGSLDWLLGRSYFFSTAELQVPLNMLVRLLIFSDVEGIVAVDFGGVSNSLDTLFDRRVLNLVLGFNFGIGPLVFRLHFAKPFDIGAPFPNGDGSWVTNFSLGLLYF
jgi:hypothetical protein